MRPKAAITMQRSVRSTSSTTTVRRRIAYIYRPAHLVHEERPIALTEIDAQDRPHAARNTAEVLEIVHTRIAPDMPHDDFILRVIDDTDFRQDCSIMLAKDSVPLTIPSRRSGGLVD